MKLDLFDLEARSGAVFSPDRVYRYELWRRLTYLPLGTAKVCVFVMLNPSKADEKIDDATIRRCMAYARMWGYDIVKIVNLYAFRATDPHDLEDVVDPIGIENDATIARVAREASMIVCAWGCSKQANMRGSSTSNRQREVVERLELDGHILNVLRVNRDGTPAHPLYLPSNLTPQIWQPEFRE